MNHTGNAKDAVFTVPINTDIFLLCAWKREMDSIVDRSIKHVSSGLEVDIRVALRDVEAFEAEAFSSTGEIDPKTVTKVVQELSKVKTRRSISHTAATRRARASAVVTVGWSMMLAMTRAWGSSCPPRTTRRTVRMWAVMWAVMWAEAGRTGVVSTTTKGHATGFFACLLCVQGSRIDLRRILGVIFDGWLFLRCFLALFGGLLLLLLLGRSLLIGTAIMAEGKILRTISSEEGVIFEVGHEVKEWMWWWVEVMDRRHDVGVSVPESDGD